MRERLDDGVLGRNADAREGESVPPLGLGQAARRGRVDAPIEDPHPTRSAGALFAPCGQVDRDVASRLEDGCSGSDDDEMAFPARDDVQAPHFAGRCRPRVDERLFVDEHARPPRRDSAVHEVHESSRTADPDAVGSRFGEQLRQGSFVEYPVLVIMVGHEVDVRDGSDLRDERSVTPALVDDDEVHGEPLARGDGGHRTERRDPAAAC